MRSLATCSSLPIGLGIVAGTIVLYLLWRRLSGVERRMEFALRDLPNELHNLTSYIRRLLEDDLRRIEERGHGFHRPKS
jgi:hypothetical protein